MTHSVNLLLLSLLLARSEAHIPNGLDMFGMGLDILQHDFLDWIFDSDARQVGATDAPMTNAKKQDVEKWQLLLEKEQSRRVRAEEEKSRAIQDLRAEKAHSRRTTQTVQRDLETCNIALKKEDRKVSECRSQLSQHANTCKNSLQQAQDDRKIRELQQQLIEMSRELSEAKVQMKQTGRLSREYSSCRKLVHKLGRQLDAKTQDQLMENALIRQLRSEIAKLASQLSTKDKELLRQSRHTDIINDLQAQLESFRITAEGVRPVSELDNPSISWTCVLVVVFLALVYWKYAESRAGLEANEMQLSGLRRELELEVGGMMNVDQHSGPDMRDGDFMFNICDDHDDNVTERSIKIQCPGVRHSDIHISIIINGCVVKIRQGAEQDADSKEWTQKFQFRLSEGLFEFQEDRAALEGGFLTLVFRTYAFEHRSFNFPSHLPDGDGCWTSRPDGAESDSPCSHGTADAHIILSGSDTMAEVQAVDDVDDAHIDRAGHHATAAAAGEDNGVACVRNLETPVVFLEKDDAEVMPEGAAVAVAEDDSGSDIVLLAGQSSFLALIEDAGPELQGAPDAEEQDSEDDGVLVEDMLEINSTSSGNTSDGFEHVELMQECSEGDASF